MIRTRLILAGLLMCGPVSAEIYRCETDSGVRFADSPCGDESERITVKDNRIGGNFGQNLPARPEPEESAENEAQAADNEAQAGTCRFINSTDLRRYLIRGQVVKGMTRDHVLRAFGRPPETYPTPQETWVYQTKYFGALTELTYVYFKDGCVESVVYREP
jgi:hypothetical protein